MKRQLRSTSLRQRQLIEEAMSTEPTKAQIPAKRGRKRAAVMATRGSQKRGAAAPAVEEVTESSSAQLDKNNNLNGTNGEEDEADIPLSNGGVESREADEEDKLEIIFELRQEDEESQGLTDSSSQSIQMDAIISEDSTSQSSHAAVQSSSSSASSSKKNKKEYKCQICDKHFQGLNDLRKHLRIHSDERPYPCTQCDKKFRQAGCLKNHVASQHGTDEEFLCTFCNKAFPIKERLRLHLRVHTGYKPYKCDLCSKEFARGGQVSGSWRIMSNKPRPNLFSAPSSPVNAAPVVAQRGEEVPVPSLFGRLHLCGESEAALKVAQERERLHVSQVWKGGFLLA